ncbi:MAG: type II toxin-antitoxin system Phd/YefM family antitoxin [Lachnospiraceae bacterium]|nr:type II toxin-antitoxin system Phd/YefM family antitoxin [Lachnospiraceae bacterium]
MKDLKEMDFTSLKNNFNEICDEINNGTEAVSLTLKSGRSVYIMPEESYNNISRFVMVNTSANTLKS